MCKVLKVLKNKSARSQSTINRHSVVLHNNYSVSPLNVVYLTTTFTMGPPLNLILLFLYWCMSFPTVLTQYCEWDLCDPVFEYCCEYNTCCVGHNALYLVAGLFGALLAIGLLTSFLYLKRRQILFYLQWNKSTNVKYTSQIP